MHPGSRQVLIDIDVSREEEWNLGAHERTFASAPELKGLYHTLNRDLDWILTQKTSGAAHTKVKSVVPGRGLDMYRKLSQWYLMLTAGTVHEMRTKVLSPARATREEDVGSQVEKWAENWNILTHI